MLARAFDYCPKSASPSSSPSTSKRSGRMRRADELPHVKVRGAVRYREEDLRRWLDENLLPRPTAADLRLAEVAQLL